MSPHPSTRPANRWVAGACFVLALAGGMAGCALQAPLPQAKAVAMPVGFSAPEVQTFNTTSPLPTQTPWWQLFNDPLLHRLMTQAMAGNPSLEVAAARLAQAQAQWALSEAQGQPQWALLAGTSRQAGPLVNAAGGNGNLFTTSVQASWTVDLGGLRAQASQALALDVRAQAQWQQAGSLALQAELASTYWAWCAVSDELVLAHQQAVIGQERLNISESRHRQGSISLQVLSQARADAANLAMDLAALKQRQRALQNAMAVLVGEPAPGFALPETPAHRWLSAVDIPTGLPSELLTRRADLLASDASLQAAQARAGLARQAWWPRLDLTVAGGQAAPGLGDLLRASLRAWSLASLASLPLLDGGRREAERLWADAQLQVAQAGHRQAVLRAFQEVEDQLAQVRLAREQAQVREAALVAARQGVTSAWARHDSGLSSRDEVLRGQAHEAVCRRDQLRAQAAQVQALVGLIKALGGGWQGSPSPA